MDNQQRKVTVAELAWLAGFMDGEGTITFSVDKRAGNRLSPYILVSNTHFPSLEYALSIINCLGVGGHVTQHEPLNKNHKAYGKIECKGFKRAVPLIQALYPYLVTKRRQAEIVIDFITRRGQAQHVSNNGQTRVYDTLDTKDIDALREMRQLNNRNWTTLTDYTRNSGLEARTCKHCGQAYQPVQVSQVYCSVRCRHNRYVDLGPPRDCPRCGTTFEPRDARGAQKYCTPRCRNQTATARYRAKKSLMV